MRIPAVFIMALVMLAAALCLSGSANASDSMNGLKLSDMYVRISSHGQSAVFRLYDTDASEGFYRQLPLNLKLTNFRDAQWMFYPPEKLNVKPEEAYHDGKKGELSYYAPWGDVFMLYRDFYAGDEMHRLGVNISGKDKIEKMSGSAVIEKTDVKITEEKADMKIRVTSNGRTIIFRLNDSTASKELYAQLPLEIKVENFGDNEKIFYPPKKLNTAGTPKADSKAGSLAYYAPWGDVVMFYKDFGSASGLYELGDALTGAGLISEISGKIIVDKED